MSKQATSNKQPIIIRGFPSFARAEVVKALGENPKLRDSYYVRQCHVTAAYGISKYCFVKMVRGGVLMEKFFD